METWGCTRVDYLSFRCDRISHGTVWIGDVGGNLCPTWYDGTGRAGKPYPTHVGIDGHGTHSFVGLRRSANSQSARWDLNYRPNFRADVRELPFVKRAGRGRWQRRVDPSPRTYLGRRSLGPRFLSSHRWDHWGKTGEVYLKMGVGRTGLDHHFASNFLDYDRTTVLGYRVAALHGGVRYFGRHHDRVSTVAWD